MKMKKFAALFVASVFLFGFAACSDKSNDNNPTDEATTDSETAEYFSVEGGSVKDYSSDEIKDPDFKVPYSLSDCEGYIELPSYDDTKKDGDKESFYSSDKLVFEKTYKSDGKLASVCVYEADGATKKTEGIFEYDTETSYSVTNYERGTETERFKFNYGSDGKIFSAFYNAKGSEEGQIIIEGYDFNPDGSVKKYYSTENVASALLDALMSSMSGGNKNN